MFSHVSVHPSINLSVHTGGGYPSQVQGGYPSQVQPEGQYPTSGTPLLGRYPLSGVTPPRVPPPSDLAGGYPCWVYPPQVPLPLDLAGSRGYSTSGNRWSTWYATVGMPLAFTQEDFLVFVVFVVVVVVLMLMVTHLKSFWLHIVTAGNVILWL